MAQTVLNKTSQSQQKKYVLRLFVAGATARSAQAIEAVKKICDEHLKGMCDLQVIDIYQHPELAAYEQIVAVPTLIKKTPIPLKKFIGDISRIDRLLAALNEEW
jgi:circadian clock protein KaiB